MLQFSYDRALMVHGAKTAHEHMKKPLKEAYNTKQAISLTYNGAVLNIYSHHATEAHVRRGPTLQYLQYPLYADNPRESLEKFKAATKHTRNAQDLGRKVANDRKEALWSYSEAKRDKSTPSLPIGPLGSNATIIMAVPPPLDIKWARLGDKGEKASQAQEKL